MAMNTRSQNKLCSHLLKIKKETICNALKQKKQINKCEGSSNHQSQQESLFICVECAHLACGIESGQNCSYQHFYSKKHSIAINIGARMIWCFICESYLENTLENNLEETNQRKQESLYQKIFNFKQEILDQLNIMLKRLNFSVTNHQQEPPKKQLISTISKQQNQMHSQIFGLKNIGNTCFFNSVLQCLNGSQYFIEFYINESFQQNNLEENDQQKSISNEQKSQDQDGWSVVEKKKAKPVKPKKQQQYSNNDQSYNKKGQSQNMNISKQFQNFILSARGSSGNARIIDPSSLFQSISQMFKRFRGYAQQDAQELLRFLLDALSTYEEKILPTQDQSSGKRKITYVERAFGCYLCNYLKCLKCQDTNRTFDFCLDIALSIPKRIQARHKPDQTGTKNQCKKKLVPLAWDENENENENEKNEKNEKNENEDKITISQPSEQIGEQEEQEEEDHKMEIQIEKVQLTPEQITECEQELSDLKIQDDSKYSQIHDLDLKNIRIPDFSENDVLVEPKTLPVTQPQNQLKLKGVHLIHCLNDFMKVEVLDAKNNYYNCQKCLKTGNDKGKQKQAITERKFYLYDPPQILTIVIKRFNQRKVGFISKDCEHVEIPLLLNLDPYTISKVPKADLNDFIKSQSRHADSQNLNVSLYNYELFGMVVHGGGISGGHYTAYVKHYINGIGRWYYYSDTQFKEVSEQQVLKAEAYIIFYNKK